MNTLIVPTIEQPDLSEKSLREILLKEGVEVHVNTVNWSEYSYLPEVKLSLASSESHLFAYFRVKENHVLARAMNDNGNVWEDSCVEIFIADKDNEHYYNFEINCVATLLAARRLSVHSYNFLDAESFKKIIRYSSLPHCPIDRKGENVEWSMIVGIPYSVMGLGCKPEWLRANFYKCGDATEVPHFLSWNAIDTESPNFHQPEFFGKLVF